jgi:hypothetical protein
MDDKKEKTGFWQSWMTIVVLFAVVLMVAWFNSQSPAIRSESNENISIGNGNHIPIVNGSGEQVASGNDVQTGEGTGLQMKNSTVVPMDNDTFFKTWVALSFKAINENLDCISKAGEIRNLVGIETCGKLLGDNSNSSLRHMYEYTNVSVSMQIVSDEYKKALEDYQIGGVNIEIGARNVNESQMDNAIGYIQEGNMHIKLVDKMISGNDTTKENFSHS